MKRVNLQKYGFTERKEENFNDDGNRFVVYRNDLYPELSIRKLVSDGNLYLAGGVNSRIHYLTYDEYTQLNNYKYCNKLNGVLLSNISEEDLAETIVGLISYYKEYKEKLNYLEKNDVLDLEKVKKAKVDLIEIYNNRINEAKELYNTFIDNIDSETSSYDISNMCDDLTTIIIYTKRSINSLNKRIIDNNLTRNERYNFIQEVKREICNNNNYRIERMKKINDKISRK